jgi:hypothetical protein
MSLGAIYDNNVDDAMWDQVGPQYYGFSDDPSKGSGALNPGMTLFTRNGEHAPIYSPENPLFWLGALLVVATGAIYVSTSFKVGPAKGSLTV